MANNLTPWLAGAAETGGRFAFNQFPGNGSTIRWGINFAGIAPGYLDRSHLKYYVTEDATGFSTDTFVVPANSFISDVILELKHPVTGQPVAPGYTLSIFRDSPKQQPIPNFNDGSIIDEENLDTGFRQAVYAAAEMVDRFGVSADKSDKANRIAQEARARADSAISTANTASSTATNALTAANSAAATANAATTTANNAKSTADTAKATADSAAGTATNALNNSNVALTRSQEAKDTAAAAVTTANAASSKANTADLKAGQALQAANSAVTTAGNADTKANMAINKADSAISTANTAKTTADQAKATADGIDGKATQALSTANTAKSTADTAKSTADQAKATADGIDGKATNALNTANGIDRKATQALSTAHDANTKADIALGASNGKYNNYIDVYRNGSENGILYHDGNRDAPGNLMWALVGSRYLDGDLYLNRYNASGYVDSPVVISRPDGWTTVAKGFTSGGYSLFYGVSNFFGNLDNTSTNARGMTLGRDGNNVGLRWRRTEGPTDVKVWDMIVDSYDNMLKGRVVNDAVNAAADWLRVSRTGMAVDNVWFGTRPTWNVSKTDGSLATAWDTQNFNPSTKLNSENPMFTGTLSGPNLTVDNSGAYAGIVIKAGNYTPRIQTSLNEGMTGFVNGANTAYNFSVYDNGDATLRGHLTARRGASFNENVVIAQAGQQRELHLQTLLGRGDANVYLRARQWGGLEVVNSAHNGVPWGVADNGETFQGSNLHVGGAVLHTDGNIWMPMRNGYLSTWLDSKADTGWVNAIANSKADTGWVNAIANSKANWGAQAVHGDMTERGPVSMTTGTQQWNWLESPWVVGGIAWAGVDRAWIRFVWLHI